MKQEKSLDSGLTAWTTVIGGFLTMTTTFGYSNSFGVYQDLYTRSNTASASAVSWIGATQFFIMYAMALPAGKALDMGYFRLTTIVGTLIYVFSLFMLSICHVDKFYQLYLAQGLGMGIGAGLLYVPCIAIQTHHWDSRRNFAMGIVATGSSIGGIIFPILLNHLFKSSTGFQWGVRYSAFIVLGMLLFANLLMKPNPHASTTKRPKVNFGQMMTDIPYLITIFSVFITNWGIFFPYFYLQLFSILHGIDPQIAFYCVAILNAAGLPGRIIPNMLADRFGVLNVGIPCILSSVVLIFAMTAIKTVTSMIVFAILYGFMSGAMLALTSPILAAMASDTSEVGVRVGLAFAFASFGVLIGYPVDGALLGETFSWIKPIIFSGVPVLVGTIGLIIARQMLVHRRKTHII